MTETAALVPIGLLGNFNFPEIIPAFAVGPQGDPPQGDPPLLLRHARGPPDWPAEDGAAEYDATLARKRKPKEAKEAKEAKAAAAAATASSSSSSSSPSSSSSSSSSSAAAAPELTAAPER